MKQKTSSVKHTIFFSNTRMVLITLVLFWLLNGVILQIYEKVDRENNIKSSGVDGNAYPVGEILGEYAKGFSEPDWEKLDLQLQEMNYQLCVMDGRKILFYMRELPSQILGSHRERLWVWRSIPCPDCGNRSR